MLEIMIAILLGLACHGNTTTTTTNTTNTVAPTTPPDTGGETGQVPPR